MAKMFDADELIAAMKAAVSGIAKKDFPALTDFAQRQMKALAEQAVWIGEATLQGEFTDKPGLRDHFLKTLDQMTKNLAAVLTGLVALSVEKIWNALVGVIWNALDKATGLALPRPF